MQNYDASANLKCSSVARNEAHRCKSLSCMNVHLEVGAFYNFEKKRIHDYNFWSREPETEGDRTQRININQINTDSYGC